MDDLISRQAAIDAIEHRLAEPAYQHRGEDWYVGMSCAESELYELPSAQSERKKGKWLDGHRAGYSDTLYWYIYCSECLWERNDDDHDKDTPYCPHCGAEMEASRDE